MSFARDLEDLVLTLFGPIAPGHAAAQKTIEEAEKRLCVHLPAILCQYYLLVGRHPQVSEGMNHILPPDALWMSSGGLVFEEEHQHYYFYGILTDDLNIDDPPVMQGNRGESKWYLESRRLSDHLLSMVCWQACNVLESAQARLPPNRLELLKAQLRWVSAGPDPTDDTIGLWGEGVAAVVFTKSGDIYWAAGTDELLHSFRAKFLPLDQTTDQHRSVPQD